MTNSYPELPALDYEHTTVPMAEVIAHLSMQPRAIEVKRAAYIMFRIESANGERGINNNYAGIQADSGRWPARFDSAFSGTVTMTENGTGKTRIFLAFYDWRTGVEMLCDRVEARGLYIGGTTHLETRVTIATEADLATAYLREWVHGSADYQPTPTELASYESMYGKAMALFRNGASPVIAVPKPVVPVQHHDAPEAESEADKLMAREQAGETFPINQGETA